VSNDEGVDATGVAAGVALVMAVVASLDVHVDAIGL
jgi:hypothetical protein